MLTCISIIDLSIKQQDQMANLNFKSHHHKLGGCDLKAYFGTFAVKDVQDEFTQTNMEELYEDDVEAKWHDGISVCSWGVVDMPSHTGADLNSQAGADLS